MAAAVDTPRVSVVVSTYNRAQLVPRLVDALEKQDFDGPFEVIIVDNGSSDDTADVLERLAARTSLDLHVLRINDNNGPAPARNLGWRTARAPLIAFTDDDCVPTPTWLSGMVDALADVDIAQGQTIPNPEQPYVGYFAWAPTATFESGFYETCNIAYRRTLLEQLNGFDERFAHEDTERVQLAVWGDDMDLALRAKRNGATVAFVDGAVVLHDVKPGRLKDRLADIPRRRGLVLVLKRFPEHRAMTETRWFSSPAHAYLLGAAAAGTVVARRPTSLFRWALVLGLLGQWARVRGVYYARREWPRALPQWFVVDVTEIAHFARASVRHRTFFL
jgi:glycosyltransferase involved in cell wall biosynthesis